MDLAGSRRQLAVVVAVVDFVLPAGFVDFDRLPCFFLIITDLQCTRFYGFRLGGIMDG